MNTCGCANSPPGLRLNVPSFLLVPFDPAMPFHDAAPFPAHSSANAGYSGRSNGSGALASAASVASAAAAAAAATVSAAASVAALSNGGGGAEAWAWDGRGVEEQRRGQSGGRAGEKGGTRAASTRFAESPAVRPETQDEIALGIEGMALAAAGGFELEAFWAQAAVLYNEKAMAEVDRSAEDGSTPKTYRGPTTADELKSWFAKASPEADAIQRGGVPSQNLAQHGVAGRAAESGPAVNAMGLVSAEGVRAWFESMSAGAAANQHGVPPQVRPQRPRLLGRRRSGVAVVPAATHGFPREDTGRNAHHVIDGCRESSQ